MERRAQRARVAELEYAHGLGPCPARGVGSSPTSGTIQMEEDAQVFVGLKAFVNKNGKILAIQDSATKLWDYPGGKIKWNENLEDALKREVKEESGLEIKIGKPFIVWKHEVLEKESRSFGKIIILIGVACEYVSGEVGLSHEHSDFEWITAKSLGKAKFSHKWLQALNEYFSNI